MKIKKSKHKLSKYFMSLLLALSLISNCANIAYGEVNQSNILISESNLKSNKNSDISMNSKDLEEFTDNFFTENMKTSNFPGAAIVVVKDGKVIFKKGYGYANVDKKISVDPDKTVFRNGSVGKLFTATAIMQLYEKGLIGLNDDVNNYLKSFKVSNKFAKPVTFANIMTHSSGLDSGSEIGGASRIESSKISYEAYMKSHIPVVINEPATITNYSNSGYNLLGYLIEKISGMSYENYIKKNIFDPLDMHNSNVVSKVENMATGYSFDNSSFNAIQYSGYEPSLGCGSINSTVSDMGNFIIANLQKGKFLNDQILDENTSELMQSQHFTNSSDLPGIGYSFIESFKNNQRIIKHEGAVPGFVTSLLLIPEHNVGFYVATNSLNHVPFQFEDAFLNHYYPLQNNLKAPATDIKEQVSEYVGAYRQYHEVSKSWITKCFALFGDDYEFKINDNKDGSLTMKGVSLEKVPFSTKLIQVKPLLFQRQDNFQYVGFRKDKIGHITYLFNGSEPETSFEKIKWYEAQDLNLCFLCLCLFIFTFTFLVCFAKFIIRTIKRTPSNSSKLESYAKLFISLVCFLNLVCTIGIFTVLIYVSYDMNYGLPAIFYVFLSGLIAASILTLINVAFTFLLWKKKSWTIVKRFYYTFITIFSVMFVLFLNYWNLLGFKL